MPLNCAILMKFNKLVIFFGQSNLLYVNDVFPVLNHPGEKEEHPQIHADASLLSFYVSGNTQISLSGPYRSPDERRHTACSGRPQSAM